MSMAEETPPAGGPMRSVNVGRATVGHVQVQRMRIGTSEEKRAESDILGEIKKILGDGVDNIENALTGIEKALQKNQRATIEELGKIGDRIHEALKGGGGGRRGGGGTGGGGSGPASGGSGGGGGPTGKDPIAVALDKLANAIDSMSARIPEIAAGGGGEGGGGGGGHHHPDVAGVRGVEATFRSVDAYLRKFDREAKEGTKFFGSGLRFVDFEKLFKDFGTFKNDMAGLVRAGYITQFTNNMRQAALTLNQFASRITDSRNITRFVTDKFNTYMRLSASGLADFADVFLTDFAPALIAGRDNLKDTLETVRKRMESGLISPIGLMGREIHDVGRTFRDVRESLDENFQFDVFQRMGFREANEAIVALYDSQRRANLNADINRVGVQRNMAGQLKILDLIAQNTGKTVEEIIKATQQDMRTTAQLEASGIITGAQRQRIDQIMKVLRGQGQEGLAQLLLDVARKGGNVEQYLGKNSELAVGLAGSGQIQSLRDLVALSESGLQGQALAEATGRVTRQFGVNPFLGGVGGEIYNEQLQKIFGEAGIGRTEFRDERGADKDRIGGWFRWLGDVLRNVIPSASLALVGAIGANILALNANTIALGGRGLFGSIGGMFGKGFKGLRGGLGKLGGGAMKMGGSMMGLMGDAGGALLGAGKGLGKAAGKLGKIGLGTILKKIPLLGLVAGGVLGLSRAAEGDWLGAAGELASGAARTIPGLGTAASLGIDGMLAARDLGMFDRAGRAVPQTPGVAPSVPRKGNNGVQDQIALQTKLLEDIKTLLTEGNDLNESIKANTRRIGVGESRIMNKVFTRLFRGDEDRRDRR